MRSENLLAIILKRVNYGDSDRIITVFSQQHGKLSLLAKNVRKISSRRAPHLELFNITSLMVSLSSNKSLILEAKKVAGPDKPSGYLFYLAEFLDKILPEHVPHAGIFTNLTKVITTDLGEAELKNFVVESLWELGYLPKGEYPKMGVTTFVESIIEKKIKSFSFVDKI